mgnify:CR=1 FL=1
MVFGRVRQFADTLVGLGKKLGAEYVRHRLGRKMSDPASVYSQLGADDQAMAQRASAAMRLPGGISIANLAGPMRPYTIRTAV